MADPVPTFSYIVNRLIESYPDLAYLHLVEPGISGAEDASFLKEEVRRPPSLSDPGRH